MASGSTDCGPPHKRRRAGHACDYCRAKRIRCNGAGEGAPCPNCIDRGQYCTTSARGKRTQAVISTPATTVELSPSDVLDDAGPDHPVFEGVPEEANDGGSILSNDKSNWEYHGPRSYLSICSKPGIRWVSEKTQDLTFGDSASEFTTYITERLQMAADLSPERLPDPDVETAWSYVRAYFDAALDASLGILSRPWFENRLNSHLAGRTSDSSPVWLALRNVVYASGCRIKLAKSRPFREANQQAWRYFENALAVYARIIFFKTSIMGVQALTLMAYFTQNIGTPCLEYMLISDAVRLAFAKGLHRAAPASQGLLEQELDNRNCIFWGAYCLEKQITLQSGRPSIITDDEITCSFPHSTHTGGVLNLAYCHSLIRLSQVLSEIESRLSTVQCLRIGAVSIVRVIVELADKLDHVRNTLNTSFGLRLGQQPERDSLPPQLHLEHLVYLQYTYFNARLSIHNVITYPWVRALIGVHAHGDAHHQLARSAEVVAATCREAILLTEHIDIKTHTSVPVAFFGPMYAVNSLFVHCLDRNMQQSDLALMDIGTGFFARLQLATDSVVSIQFARQLTSLAYNYSRSSHSTASSTSFEPVDGNLAASSALCDDLWRFDDTGSSTQLGLEDWSALLPVEFEQEDSMAGFWD